MDVSDVEEAKMGGILRSLENRNLSRAERRIVRDASRQWQEELREALEHAGGPVDAVVVDAILPTLAPAMIELAREVEYNEKMRRRDPTLRRVDPVGWLAAYLYRNNPKAHAGVATSSHGRMLQSLGK